MGVARLHCALSHLPSFLPSHSCFTSNATDCSTPSRSWKSTPNSRWQPTKITRSCPEQFAILLCRHFIATYSHVLKVKVYIEQCPWQRIDADGKKHNHAFVMTPVATRFASATLTRGGEIQLEAGLKDLRVLKTTQSAFVNFVSDDYRSLPDAKDRVFSTSVFSRWTYSSININYCKI